MWDQPETESDPEEAMSELLELIQAQFACKGKSHEWKPVVMSLYTAALAPLPHDIAREIVVSVILSSPYLPTASDIWQRALDIAAPTVPEFEAWSMTERYMGRAWPKGAPPLVVAAVSDLGGLDGLWHRYHWMREQIGRLRDEFLKAYNARVQIHRQAISDELLKPMSRRNRGLFPPGSPFVEQQRAITS